MFAVYSDDNRLHDPEQYVSRGVFVAARESPQRATELLAALHDGGHPVLEPRRFGLAPLEAVHDPAYLAFLQTAHEQWLQEPGPAGPMAVPQCYAMRHMSRRPQGFAGQLGYYLSGNSVPLGPQTWRSIQSSADCAVAAAEAVAQGAGEAYALCRPPGHHAYADLAGGFCYVNNAAVAAQHLRRRFARVSVLDVDVHHGNGTQGIFYHRPDVQFVSIHADPNRAYPWYAGYADEAGAGDGAGATLNLPLPLGTEDAAFLVALRTAIAAVQAFAAEAVVVSLGLDPFKDDPSDLMRVTTAGFGAIGGEIGALGLPMVIIQEGGYAIDALRTNLARFLAGFLAARPG